MLRRLLLAALCLAVLAPCPALAADAVPGDSCATVNAYMQSGGPETSGNQYFMRCNGSTWSAPVMFTSAGLVGIGTASPATALDVAGALYSRVNNAGSGTTIDWSLGNTQYTTASCGAFTFSNMKDGGTYQLFVEGATSGTCSFSHTGLTFKMPPNHGAATASTMTVYTFTRAGTYVFVSWITGY